MTSSELRELVDISWGDFGSHTRALKAKNYIHLEDKIKDGSIKQVISLTSEGMNEFNKLITLLVDFINRSPLYNQYIDEAIKKSNKDIN